MIMMLPGEERKPDTYHSTLDVQTSVIIIQILFIAFDLLSDLVNVLAIVYPYKNLFNCNKRYEFFTRPSVSHLLMEYIDR